jgi:hypothetical protein
MACGVAGPVKVTAAVTAQGRVRCANSAKCASSQPKLRGHVNIFENLNMFKFHPHSDYGPKGCAFRACSAFQRSWDQPHHKRAAVLSFVGVEPQHEQIVANDAGCVAQRF